LHVFQAASLFVEDWQSLLTLVLQDTEASSAAAAPSFLLKLANDDDLLFTFTFVIRRPQHAAPSPAGSPEPTALPDTQINGLTFVFASNPREVENLVTREFHADPNLHKNANVELVGSYSTEGSASVTFDWTWRWKPPKSAEDKGGGWRNSCSVCAVQIAIPNHSIQLLSAF
jgi:Arf-GAP/SH3 domain/ANK repeat/PH domain-containing protein